MSSEYWNWKFRDVQPEQKRELTPQEKRKNWWHYHKWHIAAGAVLIAIPCSLVWNALHQIKPDYRIAYVGESALPDDTAAALETELAALGEDLNGDGKTIVQLRQYVFSGDMQSEMAAQATLMADLMENESYFFLLEDPEGFQRDYQSLVLVDGSLPEEINGTFSGEGTYYAWDQCPVLADMDLGEYTDSLFGETVTEDSSQLLSKLFIARRGYWKEENAAYPEGWAALWEKLTEGANP